MKRYLLFLLIFLQNLVFADTWLPAHVETYYSPNKAFKLTIYPAGTNSKQIHKESHGELMPKQIISTWATLEKINGIKNKLIWTKKISPELPASAIISNDGKYVVTFDVWGSLGYANIIAVYDEFGVYKWSFDSLKEIASDDEIMRMNKSVSSIWWGKDHFINDKVELVLGLIIAPEIVDCGNVWPACDSFMFEHDDIRNKELLKIPSNLILKGWIDAGKPLIHRRIDLQTGDLLDKPEPSKKYQFPEFSCPVTSQKYEGVHNGKLQQICESKQTNPDHTNASLYIVNYLWRFAKWEWYEKDTYSNGKREGVWFSKDNPNMKLCQTTFKADELVSETCDESPR